MNNNFDVYICNSSVDNEVAGDLRQYLVDEGLYPFMAPYDVPAGTIKADAIMQAINRCPVFIIIVSENSCKSMRVLNEIDEAARTRTRFIPFRIDDTSIPARMRYYLQAFECINGTIEPREQFDMLFNAVLSNLPVSRRQEVVSPPKPQQKEETPVSSHSNNRIFVSYSHKDKKKVYPLVEKIEHTLGVPCWIDTSGIMSSDRFIGEIRKAIDASEIVLYMYSDNAAKSSWTMKEINYANSKDKRIVPIVLEGDSMRGDSAFMFSDVNFIPISREGQEAKLLSDLAAMLGINTELEHLQKQPEGTGSQSGGEVDDPSIDLEYLHKWNWGAAGLYPIWGLFNGCWWAAPCLLVGWIFFPITNVIFGAYGSRWAWRYGKWETFQLFCEKQRKWRVAGIIGSCIVLLLYLSLCFVASLE